MEKIFFNPGDIVCLKKDITNKPGRMMVHTADKAKFKSTGTNQLIGITCVWFTEGGQVQKHRFNSKDLKHVE